MVNLGGVISKIEGLSEATRLQRQSVEVRLAHLQNHSRLLVLSGEILRHMIDASISSAVTSAAALQTEGLREIFFDQKLLVKHEVEEVRGKISVRFPIENSSGGIVVVGDSLDTFGGSILTVQSILLRITVMFRRGLRPVLLLDETLAAVADKYVERTGKFLSLLCNRLGMDILMVTHDDAVVKMADRAYNVTKVAGEAVFKPLLTSPR